MHRSSCASDRPRKDIILLTLLPYGRQTQTGEKGEQRRQRQVVGRRGWSCCGGMGRQPGAHHAAHVVLWLHYFPPATPQGA